MKKMTITVLALVLGTLSAQATTYTDSIGDDKWGNSLMDIISVEVTNDSTNIYFDIVLGDPATFAADPWARFGVGIDSVAGGSTTADAWNDKIIMSSGMDFWGGGWTAETTNSPGINIYSAALGGWPEWENDGEGSTWVYWWGAEVSNSISFGVDMTKLGLFNGDSFNFDIYTFWHDTSAADALGLPTPMPDTPQYDSGTNVLSYTIVGGAEPVYGDPAHAFISLAESNVVIEFLAESNVAYYVQSTSPLTDTNWVNVSSLIIGDGTTNSTSYPVDSDEKFYQVIQP